jgi:hypothetical protein
VYERPSRDGLFYCWQFRHTNSIRLQLIIISHCRSACSCSCCAFHNSWHENFNRNYSTGLYPSGSHFQGERYAPPLLRGGWEGFKSDMIYGKINNQLCNWYYRINKKLSVVASTNHRVFLWIYVDSFAVGIGSELFIKNV